MQSPDFDSTDQSVAARIRATQRSDRLTIAFAALLLFVAAALSLLAASPASAQEGDPAGSFADTLDVRVVNVEAVVTDKRGDRVTGLSPDSFELLVDGVSTPIEFFSEVRGGTVLAENGASPWEIAPISSTQARGTSYLVFIDDYFSIKVDRDNVLRNLGDQLAFLGPEDRMAIVAWNGHGLEMLTSWSASERELQKAIRSAMDRPSRGLERIAERNTALFGSRLANRGYGYGYGYRYGYRLAHDVSLQSRAYISELSVQVESAVNASAAALRSFGFPPGRKVMMLVSGGWPFTPADFVAGNRFASVTNYATFERGEDLYAPLVDTANLLGYTIYPVDAPGMQARATSDVSRDFVPGTRTLDYEREDEMHYTLRRLASETGGLALLNGLRSHALEKIAGDTRSFYWIGFTAPRAEDGVVHDIELNVRERGLRVRTRENFTDLTRDQEVDTAVESALLFGQPLGSELTLNLGRAVKSGFGKMHVPLTLSIPAGDLTLLPTGEDEYATELEIRIAARDDRGDMSEIPLATLRLRGDEIPEPGENIEYSTSLKMRRADHDVIVAVYDPNSGTLWSEVARVSF